jgi:hypothetical protein
LKAPIIPAVTSPEDMSNFDDFGDQAEEIVQYEDDGTNWEAEF